MTGQTYRALLIADDGQWVTDHHHETIEQVEDALADQGSRWYFYPYEFVITDRPIIKETQRIVSASFPYDELKGKTIKTVVQTIRDTI